MFRAVLSPADSVVSPGVGTVVDSAQNAVESALRHGFCAVPDRKKEHEAGSVPKRKFGDPEKSPYLAFVKGAEGLRTRIEKRKKLNL